MKKLLMVASLAGALCALTTQAAYDWRVTINWGSAHSGAGGEFLATPVSGNWGLYGISGAFETFCIEVDELVSIGGTYYAEFNSSALLGGNGGPTPDPISIGTAWLARQYFDGTLTGYNNDAATAGALQAAIWWLEDEVYSNPDSVNLNATASGFLNLAQNALSVGSHDALKADAAVGAQRVGVLRLASNYEGTAYCQDVLVPIPEPTTWLAGAMLLLPFGLSTMRILRRNRAA